jgi:hypothetical protein
MSDAASKAPSWGADERSGSLWVTGGLLLLFPYTDWLVDLFSEGFELGAIPSYGFWILIDCALVAAVFMVASMWRLAVYFVAATIVLDATLAIAYYQYYWIDEWSREQFLYWEVLISIASIALIGAAMWYRVRPTPMLFRYALPLVAAIAVAYAAGILGSELTCADSGSPHCEDRSEWPKVDSEFFQQAAQVIPALLVALALETRVLSSAGVGSTQGRTGIFRVTVLAFSVVAGAALTVLATGDEQLPATFQLTVEALALGFAAILLLVPNSDEWGAETVR